MSVGKSYAKALLESAMESKATAADLDLLELQMAELLKMMEGSRELRVALLSPATASKDKSAVIQEIAKKAAFSKLLVQFLVLLARKERFSLMPDIFASFETARLESEGAILGQIVSADPLDPSDMETLSKAFGRKLGKRVAFKTSTDTSLLAGMKITVSGVTYDGTLRSQLQQLRDRLVYGTTSTVN